MTQRAYAAGSISSLSVRRQIVLIFGIPFNALDAAGFGLPVLVADILAFASSVCKCPILPLQDFEIFSMCSLDNFLPRCLKDDASPKPSGFFLPVNLSARRRSRILSLRFGISRDEV